MDGLRRGAENVAKGAKRKGIGRTEFATKRPWWFCGTRLRRSREWHCLDYRCIPPLAKRFRIGDMHLARVLEAVQANEPNPISDEGLPDPAQHALAALIGLNDDVYGLEPHQVVRIAALVPQAGPGETYGIDAVVPKCMTIALALDDDDRGLPA